MSITYAHLNNTQGLALAMNWANKTCRVSGQLVGTVMGDGSEGTLNAQVDVALDGIILNQPPHANAGNNQTVECASSGGTSVTLDASGSTDADNNIAFYDWRRGSDLSPQITAPSSNPVATATQQLGNQSYFVRVVDTFSAGRDQLSKRAGRRHDTAPDFL